MRRITVPFASLPGMFRKYGTVSRQTTNKRLLQVVAQVKTIVEQQTDKAPRASANGSAGAVDTGNYKRSWKVSRATIDNIRGVLITNSAAYMAVIERGRGLGKRAPPRDVIARWAQRRLGLPYKEAQRAAWPIARAIARRGLYARRVMTGNPARNAYRNAMRDHMGAALDEASIRVFS